ncbi:MAG TPA: hypothetical protein VHG33_04780, partial [Woeseiaceae bacterium]|nr:hypothetical protein [Woeseiaceae bacterium]
CRLHGPIGDLEDGLDTAMRIDLDLALLDVNVGGRPVYPVAAALRDRGVPVVFMSGDQSVDEPWQHHPIVRKPFALDQLKRALEQAVRGRDG